MRQMTKILCGLTVVAVPAIASAAPIAINAIQVSENQDVSGYDVRVSYNIINDAYYLNGNTAEPYISGYANGLARATDTRLYTGSYSYVAPNFDYGPWTAAAVWTIDVSATGRTVDQLRIRDDTSVWTSNNISTVKWQVSTNYNSQTNSGDWVTYATINSNDAGGTYFTNSNTYYDLTPYVLGQSSYSIRVLLAEAGNYHENLQIFRGPGNVFDNQIWLSAVPAPEPATMGVLALSGLALIARRRSR